MERGTGQWGSVHEEGGGGDGRGTARGRPGGSVRARFVGRTVVADELDARGQCFHDRGVDAARHFDARERPVDDGDAVESAASGLLEERGTCRGPRRDEVRDGGELMVRLLGLWAGEVGCQRFGTGMVERDRV